MIAAQRRFVEQMNKKDRFRAPNSFASIAKISQKRPNTLRSKMKSKIALFFLAVAARTLPASEVIICRAFSAHKAAPSHNSGRYDRKKIKEKLKSS